MWPHTEAMVNSMIAALDESLAEVAHLHTEERLLAEGGPLPASNGFARLV
jgi:hypothetical protein